MSVNTKKVCRFNFIEGSGQLICKFSVPSYLAIFINYVANYKRLWWRRKANIHRKKRFTSFPSPAGPGMSLTKLPLGRNNSVMTSLFPSRESLVVTSRLGTGNSRTFFYGVYKEAQLYAMSTKNSNYLINRSSKFRLFWHCSMNHPPHQLVQAEPIFLNF